MAEGARTQFTAMLLLERLPAVTFGHLAARVAEVAPGSHLENRAGPTDNSATTGLELLTLDGQQVSILAIAAPAPPLALNFGPAPNVLWPDAAKAIKRQRAHVLVIAPGAATDRANAVAKARAVTRVAAAYAACAPIIGAVWVDAGNLVSAELFNATARALVAPDGLATAFWVRILVGATQAAGGARKLIAGTVGLAALGHPEIEYAPTTQPPQALAGHALSTAEYLLGSGATLHDGQTIGVEGGTNFQLKQKELGTFVPSPVIVLEAP